VDIAHGEMVEKELDRLIEKRAAVEDPEALDELWLRSERRHREKVREQHRWEWVRYFDRQAAAHEGLAESYRERADSLCNETTEGTA
jgi:hypothetical protein